MRGATLAREKSTGPSGPVAYSARGLNVELSGEGYVGGAEVMRVRIAAAAAALVALMNGALADDQQPPWAGFYVGGQGGQLLNARVSGNLSYNDPAFPGIGAADLFSPVSRQADLSKSALFGIQGGYNWQAGFLVGGIEADMSYVDAKGGFDAVTNIGPCIGCTTWHVTTDWHSLGTLRGRAGIGLGPVLFYGTAGLAWAIVKTDNKVDCVGCTASPWAWGTANESHFGLAYGGGVEWIIFPHVTIRAEYLAANFGSVNHNFKGQAYSGTVQVSPGPPPTYDYSTDGYNHDLTFQAVRGALSFKY